MAMLSRTSTNASITSSHGTGSHLDSLSTPSSNRTTATPKSTLSPETLSAVESTLFPSPQDPTSEGECARVRDDWRTWVAPFTLIQTLLRRNRINVRHANWHQPARPVDTRGLTITQERRLKDQYAHVHSGKSLEELIV